MAGPQTCDIVSCRSTKSLISNLYISTKQTIQLSNKKMIFDGYISVVSHLLKMV
jgi:hypothetical protein